MFKKNLTITTLSNLKNSESRNIRQTCRDALSNNEYEFPGSQVKQTTFESTVANGVIYTDSNNVPIWFKQKYSNTIVPTVYTAWEYPNNIPIIRTHDFIIETKIFNGANLMIPGTVGPHDERLKPGKICGIASTKVPGTILAIGLCTFDMSTVDTPLGKTGVAVEVLHWYSDELTNIFKIKLNPPTIMNTSNLKTLESMTQESMTQEISEAESEVKPDAPFNDTFTSNADDLAETLEQLRVEDIDNFLTQSLYYTITQETSLQLPIISSTFVSGYLMKNLPNVDHNQVNIKKSSWKKTAKFLKHFEKEGFLKLKGKGDDLTITGFNKEKPQLKTFVPYRIGKPAGALPSKDKQDNKNFLKVVTLYSPKKKNDSCWTALGLTSKSYFTSAEITSAIQGYIAKKNLANPKDKAKISMDDVLFDLVITNNKANANRNIMRSQVVEPVLVNNFLLYHQLFTHDNISLSKHPKKGSPPTVKMVTEKVKRGKVITRVSNFEVFNIDAKDMSNELKVLCSGSTSIEELPNGSEVQVQGPHGDIVMEYFEKHGIPRKWFDYTNKVKPKKRRS
ncbi:hypothetical protein TBLA_0I03200 [Henningerozyma blattae CBS 6284]|uniref:Uncharacterized protein n=1 Tax=Henningerozyma blattae (strain ATCC 34711 / CBS 6284 / DSM 70876 / NBRC 10599 / NRRL Y-10934 / UCD 77-7) TaxID=1071380 RepID=I2H9C3_HENB6|nr:hypothetical protein TBLA_0I03200 [Tetrapisispora blattae CBS 6284]CCH62975.1 hypothetical protein TBLA_0I03200 [Tetrapisispora blattae CBS 6284]